MRSLVDAGFEPRTPYAIATETSDPLACSKSLIDEGGGCAPGSRIRPPDHGSGFPRSPAGRTVSCSTIRERMACAGSDLTCTGLTTPARARCASSSYWPRPRLRSHPPTSMAALHLALQDNQTDPAMCPAVRLSRGRVWDTKVSVLAQPSKRRPTVDCLAALGSSGLWTFVWRGLTSGRRWGHGRPPNADRNSNGSQSR